jgi:hypothetical protein
MILKVALDLTSCFSNIYLVLTLFFPGSLVGYVKNLREAIGVLRADINFLYFITIQAIGE